MDQKRVLLVFVLLGACAHLSAAQRPRDIPDRDAGANERCGFSLLQRIRCTLLRFRTLSGVCNNLCKIRQGSANTPFARLLPPAYDNGIDSPRQTGLPNARQLSRQVFTQRNRSTTDPDLTHMTMAWGQFLAHDITLAEQPDELDCGPPSEECPDRAECIGIDVNPDDAAFVNRDIACITLRRSSGTPNLTAQNPRQQINILTAYIDASHIYGVSREELESLRDTSSNFGLLRVRNVPTDSSLLPLLPPTFPDRFCLSTSPLQNPCFLAGDFRRNNENQGLMAMHTLFVREHNRIAMGLHYENPQWSSDRLLLEARKIMGAIMQHITYNEWLPALFPSLALRQEKGVELESNGQLFGGYDTNADATIINAMVTAAMRMGHSLVRPQFTRRARNRRVLPSIPTSEFYNPVFLYDTSDDGNGVDGIMQGLVVDRARRLDGNFVREITEDLNVEPDVFIDLPATNVQRGRDHGLPPYNDFRELSGQNKANAISDFGNIRPNIRDKFAELYNNDPNKVDLYAGGIHETPSTDPQTESKLGPTFTHILLEGFKRLRFGDRFWYERAEVRTGFNLRQLAEIRKISLARIICDNTDDIETIQQRVFLRARINVNKRVECRNLPSINLRQWKQVDLSRIAD